MNADGVLDGTAWDTLVARIAALKDLVHGPAVPGDELHRAEGTRYLLRFLAAGIAMCVEHDDVDYPELGTMIENHRSWGLDNPDTKYSFTRLAPDAAYVLRGDPGTACYLEMQVNTGHFADGDMTGWRALSRLIGDDLRPGPDGSVEIHIAPERPAGASNWMATGSDASYLHLRECFADWEAERPALFDIERVGAKLPCGPLSARVFAERLALLDLWLDVGARCWWDLGAKLAGGEPGTITPFLPPATAAGLGGQAYGMGPYACAPGEAVILEFVPPKCRYWSLSLATWFWESADLSHRQCSLNHAQAAIDGDGVVRAVISHEDPGVANWLDPAGYRRGTLAVRYVLAESIPVVTQRTVPFDRLREELPSTSARVSRSARAEAIRRRRRGAVARYRR